MTLLSLVLAAMTAQTAEVAPDGGVAPVQVVSPPADPAGSSVIDEPVPPLQRGVLSAPVVTESRAWADRPWWQRFQPNGFMRAGVFYGFPFADDQLVGSRGGLRLLSARLGMDFVPLDEIRVSMSIDAAAPLTSSDDPLSGRRIVELRDAFFEWRPFSALGFRVGQFYVPYDAETLLDDAYVPFINRSVVSSGQRPPDAYGPRDGLSLGRQLAIEVSSTRLGNEKVGFRYFAAVMNGNGQNQLFNDNNSVGPVARLEMDLFKIVAIGVNGYYHQRTEGTRPNRLNVDELGYGADVRIRYRGFSALFNVLGRQRSYQAAVLPKDSALGVVGQVLYWHQPWGIEGGVRFAWYEPSVADVKDQVTEIAAMLGYRFTRLPLRIALQYTHRGEEAGVSYPNDALDLMAQVTW